MGKMKYSDGTTPKVCIVGAGFSGLTAAIKLKKDLGINTFTLFDENKDVGGTWLVNTYPGCACDVQSHLYSWSFEPNPDWSKNYSPQPEIWEYIRNVAIKYDLYSHIRFNSHVKVVAWDESINKWRVTVFNKEIKKEQEQLFDILINGPGALRVPVYPKEFDAFKGPVVHSAEWDSSFEYENKIVGVVGAGASAVQVITEIAPKVKELHCYQRKPAWISPRDQYEIPNVMKLLFRYIPPLMWFYRWFIFGFAELKHGAFYAGTWFHRLATWAVGKHLQRQMPDETKRQQLTPKYAFGCKRVVKSSDYYPALALSHVKIHSENITQIKDTSITTGAGTQKLDVLILATGFDVQGYFDPMKILGTKGLDVGQEWKKTGPQTYYGICSNVTPNCFVLLGPNTALGHNSVVFMIECQMNFIAQVISEMIKRDAKRVTVKRGAQDQFMDEIQKELQKTVWGTAKCGSWYANDRGMVTTLWPWNCTNYWKKTKKVDYSKFEFLG